MSVESAPRDWRISGWAWAAILPVLLAVALHLADRALPRSTHSPLLTLTGLIALLMAAVSAYTDLRWRRIRNWATYGGALWGIAINAASSAIAGAGPQSQRSQDAEAIAFLGAVGIRDSLLGGSACLLLMLFVYSLARGGAGDVKLAAALGFLLGWRAGLSILLATYVLAGTVLLAWAIVVNGPLFLIRAISRQVGAALFPVWVKPPGTEEQLLLRQPVPLGAFFAVATLGALLGIRGNY